MGKKTGSRFFCICLLAGLLGTGGCGLYRGQEAPKMSQPKQTVEETEQHASGNFEQMPKAEERDLTSADRYVYGTLDVNTQKVYNEIYGMIMNQEEKIKVSTLDIGVLDAAYKAVTADYGGIFWASGYVYTQYTKGEKLVEIEFAPKYTMTRSEREEIQLRIDERVREILSGIPMEAGDYEKAKYVFEYLAANVDYELGSADNQNIISVFLNQKTVCQGYASATQYLLDQLGIQSSVVTGQANGESHAWNLARLDGEYYYIDTTWGNSTYAGEASGMNRFINYNYFGVTSEEIFRTHTANDYFILPECTQTADNYYVREGRYFDAWDPDAVGEICRNIYDSGGGVVSVKFATGELYRQTKQYFIDEEHIADYCNGISSLYYVEDEQQNVLTFSFS